MSDLALGNRATLAGRAATAPLTADLAIVDDIAALEADWRSLQDRAVISPYQIFDFVAPWVRHAAAGAQVRPRIGTVRDASGRIVMIMPFGVANGRLAATAGYLGGTHSNVNMPLVDPEFAARADAVAMAGLIDAYCRRAGADLAVLSHQPRAWLGVTHPFAGLPCLPSTDDVKRVDLGAAFEEAMSGPGTRDLRSKLRRKQARLRGEGAAIGVEALDAPQIERALSAFLDQKAVRLAGMGAGNPFAEPGIAAFLRDASFAGAGRSTGLHWNVVDTATGVLAVQGLVRHGAQVSLMVQSFATSHALARYSPGEVLLADLLARSSRQGVAQVDFGLGDARYKTTWSNASTAMVDCVRPVTPIGHAAASLAHLRTATMRAIKGNDALYGALKTARRRIAAVLPTRSRQA